jgi:WD40 repeat protein
MVVVRLSSMHTSPTRTVMPRVFPSTVLRGHVGQVQCLEFCNESDGLLSGDSEGYLHVWNVETARSTKTAAHSSNAGVIQVQTLHENLIATQGRDGEVKFWHLAQGGGRLEGAGTVPGSGYHFCKCRARGHECAGNPIPQSSLTTYDSESYTMKLWDMRERKHTLDVVHDKQFGLSMCLQIDAHQTPLLLSGCVLKNRNAVPNSIVGFQG